MPIMKAHADALRILILGSGNAHSTKPDHKMKLRTELSKKAGLFLFQHLRLGGDHMKKEAYFVEYDELIRAITFHDYKPCNIDSNAHDVIVQICHIIIEMAIPLELEDSENHGNWLWIGEDLIKWSCSICGRGVKIQENFCPQCGRKMKVERSNNTCE